MLPNLFSQFYIENASLHCHKSQQSHGLDVINPTNKFSQRRIRNFKKKKSIPAQFWSFHRNTFSKKVKTKLHQQYTKHWFYWH